MNRDYWLLLLKYIENMKKGKSLGIEGFITEFYKFFWIELHEFIQTILTIA